MQQLAQILKVDPAFFFEGAPLAGSSPAAVVMDDPHSPSADLPSAFLTNAHGLRLMRAFMRFPTSNIRGRFAEMAEEIADACGAREAPPLRKTG